MEKDIRLWEKTCHACQCSKTPRHIKTPIGEYQYVVLYTFTSTQRTLFHNPRATATYSSSQKGLPYGQMRLLRHVPLRSSHHRVPDWDYLNLSHLIVVAPLFPWSCPTSFVYSVFSYTTPWPITYNQMVLLAPCIVISFDDLVLRSILGASPTAGPTSTTCHTQGRSQYIFVQDPSDSDASTETEVQDAR